MIRITGFSHREALAELIGRWMLDRLEPGDPSSLLELIHFNSVLVGRSLSRLAEDLLRALRGEALSSRIVLTKGDLKDQLITHLPRRSERARRLIADYRAQPGRFYRETPYRGRLYFSEHDGQPVYVGSSRIKRIRRLAEKSARKIVRWLYEEIELSVAERPDGSGDDIGWAMEHQTDPQALERMALTRLRRLSAAAPADWPRTLEINDVAGIKILIEPAEEGRLMRILSDLGCRLIEREHHQDDYRAVNLLVDHQPDPTLILARPLPDKVTQLFAAQGIAPEQAQRQLERFVHDGEPSLRVEIICTSAAETLEGEIGRCMHEDRIIRQRQGPEYQGQLAQNLEFLLELLLTLPAAPPARLARLPVRLWDRYLPDYFDEVRRILFQIPSVELDLE
jgi:hypothetical protein